MPPEHAPPTARVEGASAPVPAAGKAADERAHQTRPSSSWGDDSCASTSTASHVFNTAVTENNVPTVLSKLQKWGDYSSYGEPVAPSRFIPMKTPLSPTLLAKDAEESLPNILTLPKFLAEQLALGRKVGLIIDLSNHDCLYTDGVPNDLERVHVRNVAKSVPNVECTDEVIAVASEFWSRRPEHHIAIHCAYGFNRTGFVLCCYLIQTLGMSAEQALDAFAAARAPGVKHERFREALRRRYPLPGCSPVIMDEPDVADDRPGHASRPSMDLNETLDLDLQLKMPRSSSQSTLAEVEEGRLEAAT